MGPGPVARMYVLVPFPSTRINKASFAKGVSTSEATLMGTATTFNAAGTYHFELASLDGPYSVVTTERPLAAAATAQGVSASLTGLPPGQTFRVQLVVTSNEANSYSDLITFATAPNPPVVPRSPDIDPTTIFGCVSPRIDSYTKRPDPGDVITITGRDLGLGGTVALGDESFTPAEWVQTGFKVQIPDDADGTLPLTVNCGHVSNTIAIAIFDEPDNAFSVPSRLVAGKSVTLSVRVPGPGKLDTSGARVVAMKMTIKKAGEVTVKVGLNGAGSKALGKARTLKAKVRVRFTPADGKPATKSLTITFQRKVGR